MSTVGPKFAGVPQFARGRGGYNDAQPAKTESTGRVAGKKQGVKKPGSPSMMKRLTNDVFQKG